MINYRFFRQVLVHELIKHAFFSEEVTMLPPGEDTSKRGFSPNLFLTFFFSLFSFFPSSVFLISFFSLSSYSLFLLYLYDVLIHVTPLVDILIHLFDFLPISCFFYAFMFFPCNFLSPIAFHDYSLILFSLSLSPSHSLFFSLFGEEIREKKKEK